MYESPRVVESFDALEIFGIAEGNEVYTVGNGSQISIISIGA
jgi:hypothetical protein